LSKSVHYWSSSFVVRIKNFIQRFSLIRRVRIGFYIIVLIVIVELVSSVLLNTLIHPDKLTRFDNIYLVETDDYVARPHPYLRHVSDLYISETEEFLKIVGNRSENELIVTALGGSTTMTGYPQITEEILNKKLFASGSNVSVKIFNFGVSGWTSIDSIQNYFYLLKYGHPDIVIVHHNVNYELLDDFFNDNEILYYPWIHPLSVFCSPCVEHLNY